VITEALRRLDGAEYDGIWDRFDAEFHFRPSTHVFPGVAEPSPSITWSLDTLNYDPEGRKLDRLVDVVQDGLAGCSRPGESLCRRVSLVANRPCFRQRSCVCGMSLEGHHADAIGAPRDEEVHCHSLDFRAVMAAA
jgi:hypothetical protein